MNRLPPGRPVPDNEVPDLPPGKLPQTSETTPEQQRQHVTQMISFASTALGILRAADTSKLSPGTRSEIASTIRSIVSELSRFADALEGRR